MKGDAARRFVVRDPKLGWLDDQITMPGYGHRAAQRVGPRRPFLFYGDSFTACATPERDCWQGLLTETPFNQELYTINYGTAAYGVDQVHLLFQESIDQWLPRNPIVAIGILVDNDLDRTIFDYRGCPKPLYRVGGEELLVELPGVTDFERWLEEHPPEIESYLVRYLSRCTSLLPSSLSPPTSDHPAIVARKKELSGALFRSLQQELEARELDYLFVLFFGPRTWRRTQAAGWRELFTIRTLDSLGIPWVSARRAMQESARIRVEEQGIPER